MSATTSYPREAPSRRKLGLRAFLREPIALVSSLILLIVVAVAVFAPSLTPYEYAEIDRTVRLVPPSTTHLMGTDHLGRDVWTRVAYGARISVLVGLISVTLAGLIGAPLGLIAGFQGGWLDEVIMRLMDALLVFPAVLLALVVIAVLGSGLVPMSLAIALVFIPAFARLTRGSVMAVKPREYVEASRALGAGVPRVILRHVLPNVAAPIIVQISISLAYAILIEAALSYLGFGTQPPTPSWGQMLNEARSHMSRGPWLAVFPGIAIGLTVAALNLLGDRLRDILDPHVTS